MTPTHQLGAAMYKIATAHIKQAAMLQSILLEYANKPKRGVNRCNPEVVKKAIEYSHKA